MRAVVAYFRALVKSKFSFLSYTSYGAFNLCPMFAIILILTLSHRNILGITVTGQMTVFLISLFSGAPLREEVELLLPPLEPECCVEQVMNAILTD